MPEPQMLTRRSFLKKGLVLAGSVAAGGLAAAYSAYVEPRWYEMKRLTLSYANWPPALHGAKVLQFSDLHLGHHFGFEQLQTVIDLIRREQADLICFTGDLYDSSITENPAPTSQILSQLEAPLGKWAVLGNHDKKSGRYQTEDILADGGFHVLVNEHRAIRQSGALIQIAGVADMLTGTPNLDRALRHADPDAFTLLLSHCPDYADHAARKSVDLQLSGHSHGGQIRLPFIGAVTTPPGGKKYVNGLYSFADSRLRVYTNRGIGTTFMPVRFLCRPEITVITLENKKTLSAD